MNHTVVIVLGLLASFTSAASEVRLEVRSGTIDVEGGSLFYETTGSGETLVLIHDGLIHHKIWDQQFAIFAKHFTVVRYDRRGYGRSPQPQSAFSNLDDLLAVYEHLEIDRAGLVGMSAGGGLAVDFTLAHPARVRLLVLVGAVVSGFSYTEHMSTRGGRFNRSFYGDPEAYRRYWTNDDPYAVAPQNTAARKRFRELIEANPHNLHFEKFRIARKPARLAIGVLGEIHVPTLIIVGEHDIPDVHAHAGALAAGITDSRRIIVPGAGHLVPLEQPEPFNRGVLEFVKVGYLLAQLEAGDVAAVVQELTKVLQDYPELIFGMWDMDAIGTKFLRAGKAEDALAVFQLNALAYPEEANCYDSLGAAYRALGDQDAAIRNYKRALELDPEFVNAAEALLQLERPRQE